MFTVEALLAGAVAAYVVGLSKTGLPGAAIVAVPLFATVFEGRLIPGATLPVLICADLFAVGWYHHHARWDVLRPLAAWLGVGFGFGIAFFVLVGDATRPIEIAIGLIVLAIVAIQLRRTLRPSAEPLHGAPAPYGATGGFTTFVANAAGPVINSYLASRRLPKSEHLGTSAWLYFGVNLAKIPFYLALAAWSDGGSFFTRDSLLYDLAVLPAILLGVASGRAVFHRIPQRTFLVAVLVLSGLGAIPLLW